MPADKRNGFDGLCALVTEGLQRDPLNGDVCIAIGAWVTSALPLPSL